MQNISDSIRTWAPVVSILLVAWQIWLLRRNIQSSTYQRIYEVMIKIDEYFIAHEELKPFFYPNARGPKRETDGRGNNEEKVSYDKLVSTAEMMADYFDNVFHQKKVMPKKTFQGFSEFMRCVYNHSDELKAFIEERQEWYPKRFIRHLKG